MRIEKTGLEGVFIIEIEPVTDVRGLFGRTWCREEMQRAGLDTDIAQCSVSWNEKRGTLRGLHYQEAPWEEIKIVRCTSGAVFDVVVDLRKGSGTRGKWISVELTASNHRSLYIPKGCAHGFQTLEDGSEVFYQISTSYRSELQAGIRWDDPELNIRWPITNPIISERDRERSTLA